MSKKITAVSELDITRFLAAHKRGQFSCREIEAELCREFGFEPWDRNRNGDWENWLEQFPSVVKDSVEDEEDSENSDGSAAAAGTGVTIWHLSPRVSAETFWGNSIEFTRCEVCGGWNCNSANCREEGPLVTFSE